MSKLQTIVGFVAVIGLALLIVVVDLTVPVRAQGRGMQDLKQVLTPPADTVDAQNVRIWLPRERRNSCRVTIDIYDDSSRVVRHLLNEMLSWGYYNFYWDKKDDSGRFVPSGTYPYRIDNCGTEKKGTVKAHYRNGETAFEIYPEAADKPGLIAYDILEDSVPVTMSIMSAGGRIVDTIAIDSLMNAGHYEFQWAPSGSSGSGLLKFMMTVGEFSRQTSIRKP